MVGDMERMHSDPPVKFGHLVVVDHFVHNGRGMGRGAKRFGLSCRDRATTWLEAAPRPSKCEHTIRAVLRDCAEAIAPTFFFPTMREG